MCYSGIMFQAYYDNNADKTLIDASVIALNILDKYILLNTTVNVFFMYASLENDILAKTNFEICPSFLYNYVYIPAPLFVNKYGNQSQCYNKKIPFYHIVVKISNNPSIFFFTGEEKSIQKNQYDLPTVLLHELAHGLGIISMIKADGTSSSKPFIHLYDMLLFNINGDNPFNGLDSSILISDSLYYHIPFFEYKIYSYNPFIIGRSLTHGIMGLLTYDVPIGISYRMMDEYVIQILNNLGYIIRNCDNPDISNICRFCSKGFSCHVSDAAGLISFLF